MAIAITCPHCHNVSYNPNDVVNRYCGYCHRYLDPCCDFCTSVAVTHRYPCKTFVLDDGVDVPAESLSDWVACKDCAALIDANDREGLVQRAMERFMENQGWVKVGSPREREIVEHALRKQLTRLYAQFWEARTA